MAASGMVCGGTDAGNRQPPPNCSCCCCCVQAKLEFVPMVSTREATFSITKPVPLQTSLLITCRIKETRGIRWARILSMM